MSSNRINELRQSVKNAYEDALSYYTMTSDDTVNVDNAILSAMLVREYGAGLDILEDLFASDGTKFRSRGCHTAVRESLAHFFFALEGELPMIRYRTAHVLDLIDELQDEETAS